MVLLPPGVNTFAVDNISYHIISFLTVHLRTRKISPMRLFDTKPVIKFKKRTPYHFWQTHYTR